MFGQVFAVKFDFRAEVLQVFNGVAPFASGHVQNEDEYLAAGDVAQEFVPQAAVAVCAFNDAGDVRYHAAAETVEFHHADDGLKCRERIVGDFRLGCGNVAQQRAFAGIGVAHQPRVRNAAQFHEKDAFLPFPAQFRFRGGLVGGGTEVPVAFAADAALAQREPGSYFRQVRDFFQFNAVAFPLQPRGFRHGRGIAAVDDGAGRNFPDDGFPVFAVFFSSLAAYAVRSDQLGIVKKGTQVIRVRVHFQNDATAIAAVPAVRAALGHEFGPAEADQPVSSLSCLGKYADVVNKHGLILGIFGPKARQVEDCTSVSTACDSCHLGSRNTSGGNKTGPIAVFRIFFRRAVLVCSPLAVLAKKDDEKDGARQRNEVQQKKRAAFIGIMQASASHGQRRE